MFEMLMNLIFGLILKKDENKENWYNASDIDNEIHVTSQGSKTKVRNGLSAKWKSVVKNTRITSPFGWRNTPDGKKFHYGTDYTSHGNELAYAPCACIVSRVLKVDAQYPCQWQWKKTGWKRKKGIPKNRAWNPFVELRAKHNPNILFLYAHGEDLVDVGERVGCGEPVIVVGNFGNSRGAHLHFGVKIKGKWINPAKFLKKMGV